MAQSELAPADPTGRHGNVSFTDWLAHIALIGGPIVLVLSLVEQIIRDRRYDPRRKKKP